MTRAVMFLPLSSLAACALVANIDTFEPATVAVDAAADDANNVADAPFADVISTADVNVPVADAMVDVLPADGCACASNETCESGVCIMATGLQDPRELVVVGTNVVFTERGASRVRACPVTGCPPTGPTDVRTSANDPQLAKPGLGAGRAGLFTNPLSIGAAFALNDDATLTTMAASDFKARSMALDATRLLVANDNGVFVCQRQDPSAECGRSFIGQELGKANSPFLALASSDFAVWKSNGRVIICPIAAHPDCEQFANGVQNVQGIAPEIDNVYAFTSTGTVLRYAVASPPTEQVMGVVNGAVAIASAPDNLYFASSAGIVAMPKATKVPVTRYPVPSPIDVAVSGTNLFWIDGQGRLARATR